MTALYELKSYQQTLIDKMQSGGFKPNELFIITARQGGGKSMLSQWLPTTNSKPKFEIITKADVDGATWYTVSCTKEISEWLRSQPKEWHYEALAHGWVYSQFDIHEKLYTLLALRWS